MPIPSTNMPMNWLRVLSAAIAVWIAALALLTIGELTDALPSTLLTRQPRDLFQELESARTGALIVQLDERVTHWSRLLFLTLFPIVLLSVGMLAFRLTGPSIPLRSKPDGPKRQPAPEIKWLNPLCAVSNDSHSPTTSVPTLSPAGPWRRFFARLIDIWVLALPAGLALGLMVSSQWPGFGAWMQKAGSDFAVGWLILPFVLVLESLVFAVFGSTPGKALLRVHVRTALGTRPTLAQYLNRQIRIYWFALGIGLPLISLFTMARQHSRLKAGEPTRYDQASFLVQATKLGITRSIVASLVVAILFFLIATLTQM